MALCFLVSELTQVSHSVQGLGSRKLTLTVCSLILFLGCFPCLESPPFPSLCLPNDPGRSVTDAASFGVLWDPPRWTVSPLLLYALVGTISAHLQSEIPVGHFLEQTSSWEPAVAPFPGPWLAMKLTGRMMLGDVSAEAEERDNNRGQRERTREGQNDRHPRLGGVGAWRQRLCGRLALPGFCPEPPGPHDLCSLHGRVWCTPRGRWCRKPG